MLNSAVLFAGIDFLHQRYFFGSCPVNPVGGDFNEGKSSSKLNEDFIFHSRKLQALFAGGFRFRPPCPGCSRNLCSGRGRHRPASFLAATGRSPIRLTPFATPPRIPAISEDKDSILSLISAARRN